MAVKMPQHRRHDEQACAPEYSPAFKAVLMRSSMSTSIAASAPVNVVDR